MNRIATDIAPAFEEVTVGERRWEPFTAVLDAAGIDRFTRGVVAAGPIFEGRTVWNVNSTARGGGVAEMLDPILAYARGIGIDARWLVVRGDPTFFAITKRLHNRLHGAAGDGGALGPDEHAAYERTLLDAGRDLVARVRPGDIVILHDPQTAGLIPPLHDAGVPVVWRCHIGVDRSDELVRSGQEFLLQYAREADRCVFSRPAYAWDQLLPERLAFVMPSIDPFAPKNVQLDPETVANILATVGVTDATSPVEPLVVTANEDPITITSRVDGDRDAPLPADARFVLQVSRWDELKDPIGVIDTFARHVAAQEPDVQLVYAGPDVAAVSDDPEGAAALERARAHRAALPAEIRARVHLLLLPMEDLAENAIIVNALQRAAAVVLQKSIAEGFGLTVTEAMWKARPIVATAVGGIADQIDNDRCGLLIPDPRDLAACGDAILRLLRDATHAAALGAAARERVRLHFLSDRSLIDYLNVLAPLAAANPR